MESHTAEEVQANYDRVKAEYIKIYRLLEFADKESVEYSIDWGLMPFLALVLKNPDNKNVDLLNRLMNLLLEIKDYLNDEKNSCIN